MTDERFQELPYLSNMFDVIQDEAEASPDRNVTITAELFAELKRGFDEVTREFQVMRGRI